MIIAMRNKTCSMKNLVHCMIKINQPTIRFESTTAARYPDYQMIYKFRPIGICSIINRVKLYQTFATGIGIPTTTILTAFDAITTETAIMFTTGGITWCAAFYFMGFLCQNRIGYMYLKDDKKIVKVSYADFWGRRVDTDIDINDICPLSDLPITPTYYLYYSLRQYSTKKTLKFNIKYASIVDPEKFQLVFGNPPLNV